MNDLMPSSMHSAPVAALRDYTKHLIDLTASPMAWDEWWAVHSHEYKVAADGAPVTSSAALVAAGASEAGGTATTAAPAALFAAEVSGDREVPARTASGHTTSAAQIVPGGALTVQPPCTLHPSGRPSPRSLCNDIARELLTDFDLSWLQCRRALERAQMAVDCASNWVLVFGPQALIDEVCR